MAKWVTLASFIKSHLKQKISVRWKDRRNQDENTTAIFGF